MAQQIVEKFDGTSRRVRRHLSSLIAIAVYATLAAGRRAICRPVAQTQAPTADPNIMAVTPPQ